MEKFKNLRNKFGVKVDGTLWSDSIQCSNVKMDKNIHQVLHFKYEDFLNLESFYNKMMWGIKFNTEYSILVRINYTNPNSDNVKEYKMLGNSQRLNVSTHEDLVKWFSEYYNVVGAELEMSMDIYNYYTYDILEFQFILYVYSNEIAKKLVKFRKDSLGNHKDLINVSKISDGFNKVLPLTYNKESFGKLLDKQVVNNSIRSIILKNGKEIYILKLINDNLPYNKRLTRINSSINYYQSTLKGKDILVSVESLRDKNIINVYNVQGMHMYRIVDERINYNTFSRTIGNVKSYINNTGIYNREIIINFPCVYPLPYKTRHSKMLHPEWKIGSLDVETYRVNADKSEAYAIGFYADKKVKTFYINEDLDSDLLIKECLDEMLSEKYNGYTFYVHNLAKYDNFYIIPVLFKCVNLYPDIYDYKFVFRDDHIIGIKISKKVKVYKKDDKKGKKSKVDINNKSKEFYFKTYYIRIVDSYTILSASLDELCVTFNTEVRKSVFPYDFIHKNNLFYKGKKPDKKFFVIKNKDRTTGMITEEIINNNKYNLIERYNWSVKEETLSYLEKDLISLFQVIEKFNKHIYNEYQIHVVESLTISGLTMNIFLRNYYQNNIPLIKQKSVYNDLKKSYYGGITEVYKPYGKNLYLYDVNSLYPFVSLNAMPGLNCIYKNTINKDFSELKENIFGFFNCKIEAPNNYLGLLPYRTKNGLVSPVGIFEGYYFSEELRFAYENGYKITVLSGYQFDKSENVFNRYIKDLYEVKSNTTDDVIRAITKSFLNNLLGRWGLDINKYVTRFLSYDEFEWIRVTRNIRSFRYVEDKVLVTYDKEVSKSVCESHELDYKKVLLDNIESESNLLAEHDKYNDISVVISSAVTAYARIFMNKIKLDILNRGGHFYYTDTDSIVSNIKLDSKLVGKNMGQFKLVHEIKEGYFISNKSYALKTFDDKTIIKCKGFSNIRTLDGKTKALSFKDFESVYKGNTVQGTRYESKRDYNKGVLLNKNELKFSPFSYTKRVKVYDDNTLWVDTLPINMQNNMYHTMNPNTLSNSKKDNGIKKFFILFSVLILYTMCVISFILYILLIPYPDNTINSTVDILGITDFSDIVDTTDIIDYVDYIRLINLDIEDKSIERSMLREQFDNFTKLFSKNKSIYHSSNIGNFYIDVKNFYDLHIVVGEDDIQNARKSTRIDIIKPLLRYNLDSLSKDVDDLQTQLSLLKVELQNQVIQNIDVRKHFENAIDLTLHELDGIQNKISKSPKL